jgi:excisionase family DNA binding protein
MVTDTDHQTDPKVIQPPKQILSLTEVAEYVGVSRRFIEAAVASGELPVIRLGRRCLRVRRDALETYLAARTTAA